MLAATAQISIKVSVGFFKYDTKSDSESLPVVLFMKTLYLVGWLIKKVLCVLPAHVPICSLTSYTNDFLGKFNLYLTYIFI